MLNFIRQIINGDGDYEDDDESSRSRAPIPETNPYPLRNPYEWDHLWLSLYKPVQQKLMSVLTTLKKSVAFDVLEHLEVLENHPSTNPEYVRQIKQKMYRVFFPVGLSVSPLKGDISRGWYEVYSDFMQSLKTVNDCDDSDLAKTVQAMHQAANQLLSYDVTNPEFVRRYVDDIDEQYRIFLGKKEAEEYQRQVESQRQREAEHEAKVAMRRRQKQEQEIARKTQYRLSGEMRQFDVIDPKERIAYLSSASCPISNVVGNEQAVEFMRWILADSLGNDIHLCQHNLAFLGPSSAGKTMMSRVFSETLAIPRVEISPKAVKSPQGIFDAIYNACKDANIPFTDPPKLNGEYITPPLVVLLDEAHALTDSIQQALLKATERNDAKLATEAGFVLNCKSICWHIATTDLGKMFDALMTRFKPVRLRLYTREEVAKIVSRKYPNWSFDMCMEIAKYCSRVPREALYFAEMVQLGQSYTSGDAIAKVAELNGIDPYGMTYQRLSILKALGRKPMSIAELCATIQVKEEELRAYILPWLLESTPDQEPYVTVTNRHHITEVGLRELEKRGLPHRGNRVLAKV